MMNIIIGFILGFFVATVGVTGVAQAVDNGIAWVKNTTVEVKTK
mgnify:CR=1 FL=1